MSGNQTTQLLQDYLDRLRKGDTAASDELIGVAEKRLAHLTSIMIRDFPRVRRWTQEEDVSQNATLRLRTTLKSVTPNDVAHFMSLVSRQIRLELLSLTERYAKSLGPSQIPGAMGTDDDDRPDAASPPDIRGESPSELMEWTEFHERVEALPDEIRRVFELVWYEGLTYEEVGSILEVIPKTVQRRMLKARLTLGRFLREIESRP